MAKEEMQFSRTNLGLDNLGANFFESGNVVITSMAYVPYKWPKFDTDRSAKYGGYARLGFTPDEDTGFDHTIELPPVYQQYFSLKTHYTSQDGMTLAGGLDVDDFIALAEGKANIKREDELTYGGPYLLNLKKNDGKKLQKGDHGQFLFCLDLILKDLSDSELKRHGLNVKRNKSEDGRESRVYYRDDPNDIRGDWFVGLHVRLDRMKRDPQMGNQNPKAPKEGEEHKPDEWKVLVPTELLDPVEMEEKEENSSKPSSSNTKKSSTTASSDNGDDDVFRAQAESVILDAIENLGDKAIKSKVSAQLLNSMDDKKAALNLFNDTAWMNDEDRPWNFEGGKFTAK